MVNTFTDLEKSV